MRAPPCCLECVLHKGPHSFLLLLLNWVDFPPPFMMWIIPTFAIWIHLFYDCVLKVHFVLALMQYKDKLSGFLILFHASCSATFPHLPWIWDCLVSPCQGFSTFAGFSFVTVDLIDCGIWNLTSVGLGPVETSFSLFPKRRIDLPVLSFIVLLWSHACSEGRAVCSPPCAGPCTRTLSYLPGSISASLCLSKSRSQAKFSMTLRPSFFSFSCVAITSRENWTMVHVMNLESFETRSCKQDNKDIY